jgi:hypothetical protein
VLFSTAGGDAWLLNPAAVCLRGSSSRSRRRPSRPKPPPVAVANSSRVIGQTTRPSASRSAGAARCCGSFAGRLHVPLQALLQPCGQLPSLSLSVHNDPKKLTVSVCLSTGAVALVVALGAVSSTTAQEAQSYQPQLNQPGKDVQWVPTPPALVETMLDHAHLTANDRLVDLGSGDSVLVIAAARRQGARHRVRPPAGGAVETQGPRGRRQRKDHVRAW